MNPWEPERHIDAETASKLISKYFSMLNPIRIEAFGVGWDNVVYRVNEHYLFRFPQREMALAGVQREMECLPYIFETLGQVPRIVFKNEGSESHWPFFGYEPLPGKEISHWEGPLPERKSIAAKLGSYLSRLHSEPVFKSLKNLLPVDPLGRMDFSKRVPMTEERLQELENLKIDLPYEKLRQVLRAALGRARLECSSVVHGDLHFRHVILSDEGNYAGLIDWGDIHLNNPATDLQIYWSYFKPQERQEFLQHYGAISAEQLLQARSFAVFVNVALYISSLKQGHARITETAREALSIILQD